LNGKPVQYQIFCSKRDGKNILVDVQSVDTIHEVHTLVSKIVGVPAQYFCLTYHGEVLRDDSRLFQYGIQAGATVELKSRLLGSACLASSRSSINGRRQLAEKMDAVGVTSIVRSKKQNGTEEGEEKEEYEEEAKAEKEKQEDQTSATLIAEAQH